MDWQQRMKNALNYLEKNICESVDYEKAASEAAASSTHFMRMFMVITGITPAEYVRRRRLSLAAAELASGAFDGSGAKIIDMALKYGYDSPDSFARSFKREFGCLPSEAKKAGTVLHLYTPLQFSVSLIGDTPMEYRFEKEPDCKLTGYVLNLSCENGAQVKKIQELWNDLFASNKCEALCKAAKKGSKLGLIGVCMNFNPAADTMDYAVAVETPDDRSLLPEGCTDFTVPAANYAKFTSRGPLRENFPPLIKRIFTEWLPASGKEHSGGAEIEFYGDMSVGKNSPDYRCEYWVPIK